MVKITALSESDTITGQETVIIVQDAQTKKTHLASLMNWAVLDEVSTHVDRASTSTVFSTRYGYGTHFYVGTDIAAGAFLTNHIFACKVASGGVTLRYKGWKRPAATTQIGAGGPGASAQDTLVADLSFALADLGVTAGATPYVSVTLPLDHIEMLEGEAYGFEMFCIDASGDRVIVGTGLTADPAFDTHYERSQYVRSTAAGDTWLRVSAASIAGELEAGVTFVAKDPSSERQDRNIATLQANTVGGPLLPGKWVKFPTAGRLRLKGSGTVTLDTMMLDETVSLGAASYTAPDDDGAFPDIDFDTFKVRAMLTGTATAEIV